MRSKGGGVSEWGGACEEGRGVREGDEEREI